MNWSNRKKNEQKDTSLASQANVKKSCSLKQIEPQGCHYIVVLHSLVNLTWHGRTQCSLKAVSGISSIVLPMVSNEVTLAYSGRSIHVSWRATLNILKAQTLSKDCNQIQGWCNIVHAVHQSDHPQHTQTCTILVTVGLLASRSLSIDGEMCCSQVTTANIPLFDIVQPIKWSPEMYPFTFCTLSRRT